MTKFPIAEFKDKTTPFYFYDMALLKETLDAVKSAAPEGSFHVHYAIKANANPELLKVIAKEGFGADCVSEGEIRAAIAAGFPSEKIAFAGVGKGDSEIDFALEHNIFCFNVESLPELELIQEMAADKSRVANIALRVNPNIDAHTHHYITTGLKENKFGIDMKMLDDAIAYCLSHPSIRLIGLHFHIPILTYYVFLLIGKEISGNLPYILDVLKQVGRVDKITVHIVKIAHEHVAPENEFIKILGFF